jgi:hypothetical protein
LLSPKRFYPTTVLSEDQFWLTFPAYSAPMAVGYETLILFPNAAGITLRSDSGMLTVALRIKAYLNAVEVSPSAHGKQWLSVFSKQELY